MSRPEPRATAPVIVLPGRRKRGRQIVDFPDSLDAIDVDLYFADYARGVLHAGGRAVHLPFDADPADYVGVFDGVLLPGGADVDPAHYGADPLDGHPIEPERDELELALLALAEADDLPVAGICRGLQLLNVRGGGTLHQDVPEHSHFDKAPNTIVHRVDFAEGSACARLYGGRPKEVNSLHHQTIDRVADGFVVTGRSEDGTIEAIESTTRPWVAVQWHPEMMDDGHDDPIFAWLVEQAAARRAAR
ncbi:MAG: gamma-glutamyl-gamma-aminobutyrate hydrolase family protein [Acidimicrobiales bacterium]